MPATRHPLRQLPRAESNPADVAVGQLWADADPRWHGQRTLGILAVEGPYARVEVVTGKRPGRRSRIRLDRFNRSYDC